MECCVTLTARTIRRPIITHELLGSLLYEPTKSVDTLYYSTLPEIPVWHGAGDGHLLAAENELAAPHQADETYPPHALNPQRIEFDVFKSEVWQEIFFLFLFIFFFLTFIVPKN